MNLKQVFNHKLLLVISNLLFSACGAILLIAGFYLLADGPRVLLSRLLCAGSEYLNDLPQPLFYYISLGLSSAGMIALLASMIGWWATCLNTYCVLSLYFFIVLILLLVEFAICLIITMWPQCLGLNLDENVMVKALQGSYGLPGKEQLTAAIDLAQTYFNCCAINNNINYDTSLWRLQGLGQRDWTVPLTCCSLSNRHLIGAYLDPQPKNITLCQSLQLHEYQVARHTEGCLNKIDIWYRQQYILFLGATLIVAIVEFCILLSIILICTKMTNTSTSSSLLIKNNDLLPIPTTGRSNTISSKQLNSYAIQQNQERQRKKNSNNEFIEIGNLSSSSPVTMINNEEQINDELSIKEIYVQPPDYHKVKQSMSFKPSQSKYQYHISKSYLV